MLLEVLYWITMINGRINSLFSMTKSDLEPHPTLLTCAVPNKAQVYTCCFFVSISPMGNSLSTFWSHAAKLGSNAVLTALYVSPHVGQVVLKKDCYLRLKRIQLCIRMSDRRNSTGFILCMNSWIYKQNFCHPTATVFSGLVRPEANGVIIK